MKIYRSRFFYLSDFFKFDTVHSVIAKIKLVIEKIFFFAASIVRGIGIGTVLYGAFFFRKGKIRFLLSQIIPSLY
jgi:hypothetical protein